mmetsp:Transcript_9201/g.16161  ORF Transcript_9201/g.16161 Transcript_9201/m.16161 type:complete len:564 (-) Transcript_9201:1093-2784(-)
MDDPPSTGPDDLSPQCLGLIISLLTAQDCASVSCVQSSWRDAAGDDLLWRTYLRTDWAQTTPTGPRGQQLTSHRAAYLTWAEEFKGPIRACVRRAVVAWQNIKGWCDDRSHMLSASLLPGVDEAAIASAATRLGVPLPPALAALYRLHDGQALQWDLQFDAQKNVPGAAERLSAFKKAQSVRSNAQATQDRAEAMGLESEEDSDEEFGGAPHPSIFHGIFGGYCVYDHLCVTRMLPLERACWWTQVLKMQGKLDVRRRCMVIAASFNFKKLFVVDLDNADILVNSRPEYLLACPSTGTGDGVLRWFEEYGKRLQGGWYNIELLDADFPSSKAISLFPRVSPSMTCAVTRGVRVCATTLFAPEVSDAGRTMFTYSIRFSLLTEEQQQGLIDETLTQSDVGPPPAIISNSLMGAAPALPGRSPMVTALSSSPAASNHSNTESGFGGGATGSNVGTVNRENKQTGLSRVPGGVVRRCQLVTRHWVIKNAAGQQTDEVRGEGVVGKYPVLVPGGPEFVYQSCTHQAGPSGAMEGDFKFVEGTIAHREGPEWDVRCPLFQLQIPSYIY